jgi:hypothetical protein
MHLGVSLPSASIVCRCDGHNGNEQVDVIREIELGQARQEEAARWKHELAQQRGELERLYTQRMKHLHDLEDAAVSRAQDLQRAAERASFDMRQCMVAEDDRMRAARQVGVHRPPQPPTCTFYSQLRLFLVGYPSQRTCCSLL